MNIPFSKFRISLGKLPRRYREGLDLDSGINYKFSTGFKFTYIPNGARGENGLRLDGFGYFPRHVWDKISSQCPHEGDHYRDDDCSCCSICVECGMLLEQDRL